MDWQAFIRQALHEDLGSGDHTTEACVPAHQRLGAHVIAKQNCLVAGVQLAEEIFRYLDPAMTVHVYAPDGYWVSQGQVVLALHGSARAILQAERLALNCLQRMSGIATLTRRFVEAIHGYPTRILDTRKTTPLFRAAEKWAVRIGGGENHRFGLHDMILIKDNHIACCGGVEQAIARARRYLEENALQLAIEIEAHSLNEVRRIVAYGGISRIMFDNFPVPLLHEAVSLVNKAFETEASGGIGLHNIQAVAASGVDFISVGALTHSYQSVDMSLEVWPEN